jgi:hypothetical protein
MSLPGMSRGPLWGSRVLRVIGAGCFWLRVLGLCFGFGNYGGACRIFGCIFFGLILFFWSFFPLSVPIFCAEPRHKRISSAIGARDLQYIGVKLYWLISISVLLKLKTCLQLSKKLMNFQNCFLENIQKLEISRRTKN